MGMHLKLRRSPVQWGLFPFTVLLLNKLELPRSRVVNITYYTYLMSYDPTSEEAKEWERSDLEASVKGCSPLLQLQTWHLTFFFSIFFVFGAKHNAGQSSQQTALIVCHICFSTDVTFDHTSISEISAPWNRHCGIVTSNGRCVVLCLGRSVCVHQEDFTIEKSVEVVLFQAFKLGWRVDDRLVCVSSLRVQRLANGAVALALLNLKSSDAQRWILSAVTASFTSEGLCWVSLAIWSG